MLLVQAAMEGAALMRTNCCCRTSSSPHPTPHVILSYVIQFPIHASLKKEFPSPCILLFYEFYYNALVPHHRVHGCNNNKKKIMVVRIIKPTMETIHLLTDANSIEIIVDAIINSVRGAFALGCSRSSAVWSNIT